MSAIERSMSPVALDPRSKYLPQAPADGYVIGDGETFAEALYRLTTEQFTIAIDALSDPKADPAIATTATLTSINRIAAVLRLVKSSIGEESYRGELTILTDTQRLLNDLLTGLPEMRALDQLRARYSEIFRPDAFGELRLQLHRRHQLKRLQALSEGAALERALHRLRRARARFAAWPIDGATDAVSRAPIEDSFETVRHGLQRTYERGRKQWLAAADGKGSTAKWSREARHLSSQLLVLSSSWPAVLEATAASCNSLALVLADDQASAALEQIVTNETEVLVTEAERTALTALVATNRAEYRQVAATLGARIYMEPSELFIARMAAYWDARSQ